LTGGASVEQEDERTERQFIYGGSGSSSIFGASRRNKAAYAQGITTLPDSVVVTAGGRLDDNERFGKFGTYRVGANWRLLPGLHLRGSLGTAFREPTFFENFATGFVTGNPTLSPERTVSWETGLRQTLWHDRVDLGVTQFDQRFRNLIDYTGATTACGASYCNVARARSVGREFELRVLPIARLALDANLTHLETKVLAAGFDSSSGGLYHQGEQLIRRPTTGWNAGASYASTHGSFDVRLIHEGERTDRDFRPFPAVPVVDPAFTRTDVGADLPLDAVAPRLAGTAITLHVENLFDTNYQSIFNFLSPRRTVLIGARARF
ncbi:MAG: TonB-dependent receptor domain-containing protein, partial [Gemmatimonadales bacterium]